MKLNLRNVKRKAGMTLLEISVVILVLLTLIAVLFVGVQAYKRGADRTACILNQRNVQQALRTIQNTHQLATADPLPSGVLLFSTGPTAGDGFMNPPVCPAKGTYPTPAAIPAYGTLAMPCSLATTAPDLHVPKDISGW